MYSNIIILILNIIHIVNIISRVIIKHLNFTKINYKNIATLQNFNVTYQFF